MDWEKIIIMAIPLILGIGFVAYRAELAMKALKESADLLTAIVTALTDKSLTKEEIDIISKEATEALGAFKELVSKKK